MTGSTPATSPGGFSGTCPAEDYERERRRGEQSTVRSQRLARATYCFIWGRAVHAGHNKGCTYKRNLATNSQNRLHNKRNNSNNQDYNNNRRNNNNDPAELYNLCDLRAPPAPPARTAPVPARVPGPRGISRLWPPSSLFSSCAAKLFLLLRRRCH